MSVTGGSLDFEGIFLKREGGVIEGSLAKVEDQDVTLARRRIVEIICNSGYSRLINDMEDVQACDDSRALSCSTSRVIEVCRNSDDDL